MGMFNYVIVENPLLPLVLRDLEWQTKCEVVDLMLDELKISEDGRLLHHWHKREAQEADDSPFGFYLVSVENGWTDTNYHGLLHFHGSIKNLWYEVVAKFTDGDLVSIDYETRELGIA